MIPAAGTNQRLCAYGALNYRMGQSHYMVHPNKNAQQFAEFLRQLLEANSERCLVLVIDNAGSLRPSNAWNDQSDGYSSTKVEQLLTLSLLLYRLM